MSGVLRFVLAATAGVLILEYSSAVAQERAAQRPRSHGACRDVDSGKKLSSAPAVRSAQRGGLRGRTRVRGRGCERPNRRNRWVHRRVRAAVRELSFQVNAPR